ncbi:hypothetical protein ACXR0O_04775 [Verrucomicrobiota bacterium sgz303538]
MSHSLVAALAQHGFFDNAPRKMGETLRQDIHERGWPAIFEESHRLHFADAEDLAEGGVGEFLLRIRPFLTAQGVTFPEFEDEVAPDGYVIRIGETLYRIYDENEMGRDLTGGQPGLIWGLSMARAFGIVNDLLENAGSPERVYAVNGGNDLQAFFLTPELFHLITDHPEASSDYGPYVPEEEYPDFGQVR